jgi:hypothetical protein
MMSLDLTSCFITYLPIYAPNAVSIIQFAKFTVSLWWQRIGGGYYFSKLDDAYRIGGLFGQVHYKTGS